MVCPCQSVIPCVVRSALGPGAFRECRSTTIIVKEQVNEDHGEFPDDVRSDGSCVPSSVNSLCRPKIWYLNANAYYKDQLDTTLPV